jgi:ribosome maturation factor RimP
MDKAALTARIEPMAAAAAAANGVEFVHVDITGAVKKPAVCVYIDKAGGVTIDDCANVSRDLGAALDAEDFISDAYLLEVSSPGLERELYSREDFAKFKGNLAKVKTRSPINGQKNFRGRILDVVGEEVVFDDRANGEVRFPLNLVAKANLEIDLEEEFRLAKLKAGE